MKFKPVKITKRGSSYQLYYYNPRGERRRLSVGCDYQQAQRMAVRFNDWLMEGKNPEREQKKVLQKEKAKLTIKDFFPVFMERHGKQRAFKTQESYINSFQNIRRCTSLVDSELDRASKNLVLDYMYARIDNDCVKSATVNREAAFLKCMLSKAFEWGIIDTNPLHGLRLFPEAGKREVYLTVEQAKKLLDALPDSVADIVEFAIYTGFRKENILSMRFESIRFHDISPTGEITLIVKGG